MQFRINIIDDEKNLNDLVRTIFSKKKDILFILSIHMMKL